ncbi:MAG: RHS domain-containing protein, partial [Rhodanobacter sp.]
HYDAFNRMDSAGRVSYYVNPEGQRLRKTGAAGTTFFATDASGPLLAERPNGNWVDYVWLNGRLIGRVANGQIYAIHDDQVGRPEAVTDANRNVVWQAQNLAFTQNVTVATIALNLGFPGQHYSRWRDIRRGGLRYCAAIVSMQGLIPVCWRWTSIVSTSWSLRGSRDRERGGWTATRRGGLP